MGQSTNGELSYGVKFEEGYEFPWDDDKFGNDIEDWWLVESGWTWDGDKPFTKEGDYAPGFTRDDPRVAAYFEHRRLWKAAHSLPVELVNYQSGECPAYILAVPGTLTTARRGYPVQIAPELLEAPTNGIAALMAFCEKYGLEFEGEPSWWLSSYWG